jgi:DNA-binding HxlR family transcriptional regulator
MRLHDLPFVAGSAVDLGAVPAHFRALAAINGGNDVTRKQRHGFCNNCPVGAALDIIGGKWKAIPIFHILDGSKRFGELGRLLPGLTQRMLTTQLRELEADGVTLRTVYPQVPPKVDYAITEFGRTLGPLLRELAAWAEGACEAKVWG